MEINFTELTVKIGKMQGKNPNLLGSAIVTLKELNGGYLSITGFTIWKSNFGGYNVEMPKNQYFKFCLCEKLLWQKIKQEILREYDMFSIPIIEEKSNDSYYSK